MALIYAGPPEVWEFCQDCAGEGSIEIPRPSWNDPHFCIVRECETCNGAGGFICEAEGGR